MAVSKIVSLRVRKRIVSLELMLEELQARCRHPKEMHIDKKNRSYCGACDKTFWESGLMSRNRQLTTSDIRKAYDTRRRMEEELDQLDLKLKSLQDKCSHCRRRYEPHPENEIDECDTCGKPWDEVVRDPRTLSSAIKYLYKEPMKIESHFGTREKKF